MTTTPEPSAGQTPRPTTPEPSAGQTPPPPSYSEGADHEGHHLRASIVGLIVVVALAIAAGVTSAIVFTHRQSPQSPPQPAPASGPAIQPAANSAAGQPAGAQKPHMSITAPAAPVGNQKTLTGTGDAVDIEGASVTPAAGWSVGSQGKNVVFINKDDGSASILFLAGKVNSSDPEQALNGDIQNVIDKLSMSNVKVTKTETGKVQSQNFQEVAKRGFMADIATQQGTMSVVGMFLEFLNTDTQNAAFVMFMAKDEQAFDACVDDVNAMIQSML